MQLIGHRGHSFIRGPDCDVDYRLLLGQSGEIPLVPAHAVAGIAINFHSCRKAVGQGLKIDIARALGLKGKDDAELVAALCARIDQLMHAVDVEPKLSANGVTKKAFDAAVDRLASLAYDDQCTPANPRQPYIEEMKQLLIDQF